MQSLKTVQLLLSKQVMADRAAAAVHRSHLTHWHGQTTASGRGRASDQ